MSEQADLLVVGGTSGIGRAIAAAYVEGGHRVTIAGRSAERSAEVAAELGGGTRGIVADLGDPAGLKEQLADVGAVSRVVLTAAGRGENSIEAFDPEIAAELAGIKLVGYPAVLAVLGERLTEDCSVVMLGGNALDKPFPGSTGLTSVNGGVAHLVVTLAMELAPRRVNALHPGIVADTPAWQDAPESLLEEVRAGTPTGRLVNTSDVAAAAMALLENPSISGQNLRVDGGSGI